MKLISPAKLALSLLVLVVAVGCSTSSGDRETLYRYERETGIRQAPTAPPPQPQYSIAAARASSAAPWPGSAPAIYADSAIMIDASNGRTIYEKNADKVRAVASTQKLLTALIIAEGGGISGRLTTASSDTWVEPSKLGFGAGESYRRIDLLTAMMVKSSNDAAEALARDHAGSSAQFAALMNRRARQLGATNSNFLNPHGLTESGQYSTARDVARIAYRAYRNRTLRRMMLLPSYTFQFNNGRVKRLKATNKLLTRSSAFNGMKTGYTNASGRCLVSSVSASGSDLILVQLGSKTKFIFSDAERLMRWGISKSRWGGYAALNDGRGRIN